MSSKCKNCDDINKLLSDIATAQKNLTDLTNFVNEFYSSGQINTSQVNFITGGKPVFLYPYKYPSQPNPEFRISTTDHFHTHYIDNTCNQGSV